MFRLSNTMIGTGVAAVLSTTLLLAASAAAVELKLATFMSPKHPMDRLLMRPWSKEIAKMSGGSLKVRVYPAGALGKGPRAQFKRAIDGVADITFGLQGYTSKLFPRSTMVELPVIAANSEELVKKLWSVYDKYIAGEYANVKVLAIWVGEAPVMMTRKKPIRTIADFKGLKIRTPSKAQASLIRALGATPVAMPVTKMYRALETGGVDGLMVPPSVIRSFKIGEVARYFTTGLPFGRSPFFIVMNKKTWNGLSAEHKALINKTTGRDWSIKATRIYEKAGAGGLGSVRKTGKHKIYAFSAEDERKGRAILLKARAGIVADLEKKGIPAGAILEAMGAGS